ncbi:MAG: hypothetical protein JW768_04860 [Chitinispirillaceae bacterium]|nr:hypothetical protein [Chitinispirillaceae bacterium]
MRKKTKLLRPRHLLLPIIILSAILTLLSRFSYPFPWRYPVRGIDVSHHQGAIDWKKAKETGRVDFVYIKATEGTDFIDPLFLKNWRAAKQSGIARGAYHFYSLHAPGAQQAGHFLRTVRQEKGDLPPVIDLEFENGGRAPPPKKKFRDQLDAFDRRISAAYGCAPVYYLNEDFHNYYFSGKPIKNRLWIRGIYHKPAIMQTTEWLFWQYSDIGRIGGIKEKVDLNVFRGSRRAWGRLVR